MVLPIFEIPIETQHLVPEDYAQRLATADPTVNRFCQLMLIMGLLLDGQISRRERKRMDVFHKEGILELSVSDLIGLKNDFFEGRGISQLVDWEDV